MAKDKKDRTNVLSISQDRQMTIAQNKRHKSSVDVTVFKDNGDTSGICRINKRDAKMLIAELRSVFDIPDETEQLRDLLNMREERTMAYLNQLAAITIANVMTQNALHRVVLPINSASLVPRPMHVDFDIENGLLTYTMEHNEND